MAAGSTYTPIATTTLGSSATSYTFSSIASTYTDLMLVIQSKVTSGSYQNFIQVNGDTGTTYSFTILNGDGSSASSVRASNTTYIGGYSDYNTTADGMMSIFQLMNYANTSTYKTILYRGANANTGTSAVVGLWRSTSAINSIKCYPTGSGTYAAGTTLTLYGIQAA